MNCTNTMIGRFAPSPSGVLHLGNIATSLLTWLDVRSCGGTLVFRMEDLDPDRSSAAFAAQIAQDLSYLGLNWDIGWKNEYSQSNRTALYDDAFELLRKKDLVYPCYCSRSQRLAASAPHEGDAISEHGCRCRNLSKAERDALEAAGKRPAWKIKVPDKEILFTDLHYGQFRENLADSGDFIIKRSDGVYAYQLAVSFDDMDMSVTRVVRGRDLISSTARQIWLISELGGVPPAYCHAPLLLSEDKRKMSKRDGALSMNGLREKYTPEEILGYLAKCLSIGSGEPVSAVELLERFDWKRIPINDIIVK